MERRTFITGLAGILAGTRYAPAFADSKILMPVRVISRPVMLDGPLHLRTGDIMRLTYTLSDYNGKIILDHLDMGQLAAHRGGTVIGIEVKRGVATDFIFGASRG